MADDHRAAREIVQRRLQRLQRLDVQVVGRFVQQQHVAARFQQLGHVHAVAFAARQGADLLLLVAALEVEGAAIGAAVHRRVAQGDQLGAAADLLPDVVVVAQRVARLVDIGQLHRLAQGDRALVGLLLTGQHAEQRRLARAVRTDHADDAAGRDGEVQVLDQQLVAHRLLQADDLDHLATQALAVRDDDLGAGDALLLGLVGHLVIGVDAGLLLGLTGLGAGADPFQFLLKDLLLGLVLAGLLRHALGLGVQPRGIVPLVRDAAAALQLQDPGRDVVQEIAVVGDDQDRALVFDQVLLQPGDGLGVQVVGRFVQQQHVGRLKQQLAQRDPAAFAARQGADIGVVGRAAQGLHRDIDLAVQVPQVLGVDLVLQGGHLLGGLVRVVHRQLVIAVQLGLLGRDPQHDVAAHVQTLVQMRLLRQIADGRTLGGPGLAGEILVDAGHHAHQAGFARSVDADDADLDARKEVQLDVLKHLLAAGIGLGHAVHVVDELIGRHRKLL